MARPRWVALWPAALGVIAIAAYAVVGVQSTNAALDDQALVQFEAAVGVQTQAAQAATAADDELGAASTEALADYSAAAALLATAEPDFLADPATADALAASLEDLATAADLVVTDEGDPTLAAEPLPVEPLSTDPPADRAERLSDSTSLRARADRLRDAVDRATESTKAITTASDRVTAAQTALIASAFAKCSTLEAPALASAPSKEGFLAATAALENPAADADLAALLLAAQEAWKAAQASHDAASRAAASGGSAVAPTYVQGILVVNKTYGLPSTFGNGLTADTSAAFNAMKAEAATLGLNLYIASGFRSYAAQKSVYNRYVANEGQAGADTHSARPGHSEHQSGLAFDLNTITPAFGSTPEGIWVAGNAARFGFIVRYPQGKEAVTGYIWEPWHLRYLGVPTATAVHDSGLSLEEYLGVTSAY